MNDNEINNIIFFSAFLILLPISGIIIYLLRLVPEWNNHFFPLGLVLCIGVLQGIILIKYIFYILKKEEAKK